jgi:gallate decarboxylase subunit C
MKTMVDDTFVKAARDINDLRSALDLLSRVPGQLITIDEPVDPINELAGLYRHIGAGSPVKPPTKIGPAMLCGKVKGFDMRVVTGILAGRVRTGLLLGREPRHLAQALLEALHHPVGPVMVSSSQAPCREVIHRAPLDIRTLLPATTNTPLDAGPYFSMGLIRAEDPETGQADVTIHRLCVQGPDTLSVYFAPGRHIGRFWYKTEEKGQSLPISINMGLDPAVYLAACFEPPTTPLGFDELTIAGGLRGRPVDLVDCVSVNARALARAEIIIEGELVPGERIAEDAHSGTGYAMPEFPGYMGAAQPSLSVIKVKAVTHRRNPILQTIVGPGEEHVNLVGIPTEASITNLLERSMPGKVLNVYAHPAGGGKLLAVIQMAKKTGPRDEGRQRQAALIAFTSFYELKHVILVDEDVDLFNDTEILWAMTTRFQGDVSMVPIPGVNCHPLDPSQRPEFSPSIRNTGVSCKTIFDCTVPYNLRDHFVRAPFMDVDVSRFIK